MKDRLHSYLRNRLNELRQYHEEIARDFENSRVYRHNAEVAFERKATQLEASRVLILQIVEELENETNPTEVD